MNKNSRKASLWLALPVSLACVLLSACAGRPDSLGARNNELMPCPFSPNCVSTTATDSHRVDAFKLVAPADQAISLIAATLKTQDRVIVTRQDDRYLHAEFKSAVFRFVDDVEFYAQDDGNLMVRSASRLGFSDLGANRRRVENLRELFRNKTIIQ